MPDCYLQFKKNGRTITDVYPSANNMYFYHRDLMDVYLLKYQDSHNMTVTYDDITYMSGFDNEDVRITDLPANLEEFYLTRGYVETFSMSDATSANIQKIRIDHTNINSLFDVSKCPKLTELRINHANLSGKLTIAANNLRVLNLRYNCITEFEIDGNASKIKLDFCHNNLSERFMETSNTHHIMQGRYKHYRRAVYVPPPQPAQNGTEYRPAYHPPAQGAQNLTQLTKTGNVYTGGQSVHLTSVNHAVRASVNAFHTYVAANNLTHNPNYMSEIRECFPGATVALIKTYKDDVKFSLIKLTYHELLEIIWRIVCHHHNKRDIIDRMIIEIDESNGVCFVGRINRLVNSLSGILSGVVVGVSRKEAIQQSISHLMTVFIKKFTECGDDNGLKKILYIKTRADMENIMDYDSAGNAPDHPEHISFEYKQSWIAGLNDYKPDPIPGVLDGFKYFVSYDDKVYESATDCDEDVHSIGMFIKGDEYNKDKIVFNKSKDSAELARETEAFKAECMTDMRAKLRIEFKDEIEEEYRAKFTGELRAKIEAEFREKSLIARFFSLF